jgi:hypothetical protein
LYAGHFATALVLRAKEPSAPFWGILIGVGLLDLLFGPFVLIGLERASLTPGRPPGFSLDYIDWSHSLLMSLAWAAAYGSLFLRRGRRIAGVMALAVFSHFVLDLVMHPRDLALWPNSPIHLGFGLWTTLPRGWWFVELALVLAACAYYLAKARGSNTFGGRRWAVALVVLALHLANAPWLSPL